MDILSCIKTKYPPIEKIHLIPTYPMFTNPSPSESAPARPSDSISDSVPTVGLASPSDSPLTSMVESVPSDSLIQNDWEKKALDAHYDALSNKYLTRDFELCLKDDYIVEYFDLVKVSLTTILATMRLPDKKRSIQFALIFREYPWKGPCILCLDPDVVQGPLFKSSVMVNSNQWNWSPAHRVRQVLLNLQLFFGQ